MRSLLGQGLYGVHDLSLLLSVGSDWVSRRTADNGVVPPSLDGLFSFRDLISLRVVKELEGRGVARRCIARGITVLQQQFGVDRPLAHRSIGLATTGEAFVALIDGVWLDVGQRRQEVMQEVIRPWLREIDYGADEMAARWRPAAGVVLDPDVQGGKPCVEGTRLTTEVIIEMVRAEDDPREIAMAFDLDVRRIDQAIAYEQGLAA